jgi:hypothetical protein
MSTRSTRTRAPGQDNPPGEQEQWDKGAYYIRPQSHCSWWPKPQGNTAGVVPVSQERSVKARYLRPLSRLAEAANWGAPKAKPRAEYPEWILVEGNVKNE